MFKKLFNNGIKLLTNRQTNILSAATFIFLAVFLSAVLGLVRTRLLSSFFGAGRELDVYYAAFRIPDMLFQLLVMGALSSAFIPVFTGLVVEKNEQEAFKLTNICFNASLAIFLLFNLLVLVFSMPVSKMLAPGFSQADLVLMASLTRIMVSAQIFFIAGNFLTGVLQSFNHFFLPALAPVAYNLGIILGTVLLTPNFGIYGPTLGVAAGTILFFLIQLPLVLRLGYVYKPTLDFKNKNFLETLRLTIPRTLSLGVSQIEYTADLIIASLLTAGRYTIFNFALILMSVPIRLFGLSIGQASLPVLSGLFAQNKKEEFSAVLKSSIKQIFFFVIPITVLITVLRVPFVRLAFGARAFDWNSTIITGKTLGILSLGILGQSATQILIRAFYAVKNTKTPLFLSMVAVFLNVIFSIFFVFVSKLDVLGLAMSTAVSSLVLAMLLYVSLVKKRILLASYEIYREMAKIVLAGIMMAVLTYVPMKILDKLVLDTTHTINLLILTVLLSIWGISTYIISCLYLNLQEARVVFAFVSKLGNWRKNLEKSEEIVAS